MPKGYPNATLEREETVEEAGTLAPASSLPLEFLKFMSDMTGAVTALTEKVDKIEQGRQQFRPMNPLAQPGAVEKLQIPRDGKPRMDPSLEQRIPTMNGAPLTAATIAAAYPQRFAQGDRVRINPDTQRGQVRTEKVMRAIERKDRDGHPFIDAVEEKEFIPITWGELIATLPQLRCPSPSRGGRTCPGIVDPGGACETCGWAATVASVEFMDDRGQTVYKVSFPGISSGARTQAFYDYELEPA